MSFVIVKIVKEKLARNPFAHHTKKYKKTGKNRVRGNESVRAKHSCTQCYLKNYDEAIEVQCSPINGK